MMIITIIKMREMEKKKREITRQQERSRHRWNAVLKPQNGSIIAHLRGKAVSAKRMYSAPPAR